MKLKLVENDLIIETKNCEVDSIHNEELEEYGFYHDEEKEILYFEDWFIEELIAAGIFQNMDNIVDTELHDLLFPDNKNDA